MIINGLTHTCVIIFTLLSCFILYEHFLLLYSQALLNVIFPLIYEVH